MNEIDIIKNQIRAMRDLAENSNPIVKEHVKNIKEKYHYLEINTLWLF